MALWDGCRRKCFLCCTGGWSSRLAVAYRPLQCPKVEEVPLDLRRGLEVLDIIDRQCCCVVTPSEELLYF